MIKMMENTMAALIIKDEAHKLVDKMPENATWDDLIYEIYVRQVVEKGLSDSQAGRTKSVSEIKNKYGI